jgi:hypothetical protein
MIGSERARKNNAGSARTQGGGLCDRLSTQSVNNSVEIAPAATVPSPSGNDFAAFHELIVGIAPATKSCAYSRF